MRSMLPRLIAASAALALTAGSASAATVIYQDDFSGGAVALNGTTPDTTTGANNWVAGAAFSANGSVADTDGASATLAFTPVDGLVYTLDASFRDFANTGIANPDNDWIGLGFVNGQSSTTGANHRFTQATVNGIAWMLMRGNTTGSVNNTAFLGIPTSGTQSGTGGAAWSDGTLAASYGEDIDMRVVLDTTGVTWTATWYAKLAASGSYTEVRSTTNLASEGINSVGIARSATGFTGNVTAFSLTSVPEPGSLALLGLGGLAMLRRRRN